MSDSMQNYRKKPVVIQAMQWFPGLLTPAGHVIHNADGKPATVEIETLEGKMVAQPGDWIIKGVKVEFYPCKPDIFAATYDRVIIANLDAGKIGDPQK